MVSIASVFASVKEPHDLDEVAPELLWELHRALGTPISDPRRLSPSQFSADLKAARWLVQSRGVQRVRAMIRHLCEGLAGRFGVRRMVHLRWRFDWILRQLGAGTGGER